MTSSRWLSWLSRRPVASRKPVASVRPMVESLEDRMVPNGALPTTTTITNISQSYNGLYQSESVTATVDSLGVPVSNGFVAINDNGATARGTTNASGQFSATFLFPLVNANPNAHPVTATFSDPSHAFDSSADTATAGNTRGQFVAALAFDFLLYQYLAPQLGLPPLPHP